MPRTKMIEGKTKRIHGGFILKEEYEEWKAHVLEDGFSCFWTWAVWVIRQHVRRKNRRSF